MGHNKDQGCSVLDCLSDIWDSNHILGKLDAGKVFLVLVILIDDFSELPAFEL